MVTESSSLRRLLLEKPVISRLGLIEFGGAGVTDGQLGLGPLGVLARAAGGKRSLQRRHGLGVAPQRGQQPPLQAEGVGAIGPGPASITGSSTARASP